MSPTNPTERLRLCENDGKPNPRAVQVFVENYLGSSNDGEFCMAMPIATLKVFRTISSCWVYKNGVTKYIKRRTNQRKFTRQVDQQLIESMFNNVYSSINSYEYQQPSHTSTSNVRYLRVMSAANRILTTHVTGLRTGSSRGLLLQ